MRSPRPFSVGGADGFDAVTFRAAADLAVIARQIEIVMKIVAVGVFAFHKSFVPAGVNVAGPVRRADEISLPPGAETERLTAAEGALRLEIFSFVRDLLHIFPILYHFLRPLAKKNNFHILCKTDKEKIFGKNQFDMQRI